MYLLFFGVLSRHSTQKTYNTYGVDLLVNAVNEISEKKNKAYQDRVEKVLVDGISKNDKSTLTGRTDGFKLVNFAGKKELIGSIVDVKITDAKTFSLFGEVIE